MKQITTEIILLTKLILAVLLLICLLQMPYGYYQLVRFLGLVVFALLAAFEFEKNKIWAVIWVSSAVLINPIFKIPLGKEMWNIVDVIWAVLLVGSAVSNRISR